jgi:hypothetical protein
MGIRELIQGEMEDNCLVFYHAVLGKEGRKGWQGRWSNAPHEGDGRAMPTAFSFQNTKEAIVTNSVFWPQQETPDPSLEIYFHGRTKAVCPDIKRPGEHMFWQPH